MMTCKNYRWFCHETFSSRYCFILDRLKIVLLGLANIVSVGKVRIKNKNGLRKKIKRKQNIFKQNRIILFETEKLK